MPLIRMIVKLNDDLFVVDRKSLAKIMHTSNNDWVKVTEWIEMHGIYLEREDDTDHETE